MTVHTRPAGPDDVDALARFWHLHMNDRLSLQRWRTIAACPWYDRPPNHGWIAVDGGRIVGAMALVHSVRRIAGASHRLCNIGSLYVLRDYRGRGIARTIAAEATADHTITYFGIDAAPQTRAVLEPPPVGFTILDERRYLWRPRARKTRLTAPLAVAGAVDPDRLPAADRSLFAHHLSLGMRPLVVHRDGAECRLLLWVRNKHDETLYHEALYISDIDLFTELAPEIADTLAADRGAVLAADSRFFDRPPAGAECERLRQPRHYKSRRLEPRFIDLLYSEVPLLGLKLS